MRLELQKAQRVILPAIIANTHPTLPLAINPAFPWSIYKGKPEEKEVVKTPDETPRMPS